MALSKTTQDHEEIRRWAEERGGKPSHVTSTESSSDTGILRIDFPGYSGGDSLSEISWDEFFEKFDAQGLALVYQEETAEGQKSNFNKLVSADTTAASGASSPAKKKTAARKSAGRTTAAKKAPVTKTAKKVLPKKAATKKAAAKRVPAKKAPVKKSAVKKAVKKAAPKKVQAKKAIAKKAAKKAPVQKKTAAKKRR